MVDGTAHSMAACLMFQPGMDSVTDKSSDRCWKKNAKPVAKPRLQGLGEINGGLTGWPLTFFDLCSPFGCPLKRLNWTSLLSTGQDQRGEALIFRFMSRPTAELAHNLYQVYQLHDAVERNGVHRWKFAHKECFRIHQICASKRPAHPTLKNLVQRNLRKAHWAVECTKWSEALHWD